MRYTFFSSMQNELILVGRILMMILFVTAGWGKISHFTQTAAMMGSLQLPLPEITAGVVIFMELIVGIALVLGFYTRPLAMLLAVYTLGTALIAHHYWDMEGAARIQNTIHFYKNISIIGGLLLLCACGPGKYSLDKR